MPPRKYPAPIMSAIFIIDRFPRLAASLRRIHFRLREPYRAARRQLNKRQAPAPARPANDKETFRAESARRLNDYLRHHRSLSLPEAKHPKVSVLLVLYNQAAMTLDCLLSLSRETEAALETIVVDNASQDETCALLRTVKGIKIINNKNNIGFLLAANQAAKTARGEYLLLLNNDAVLLPGTLAAACQRLDRDHQAGAVGGKIVLPDGTLQEAGSIVWRDGSCLGYGRGESPQAPEFQFVRQVDYCSGAFLLVRRHLFEQLGGLDPVYAPAYYEESDFCLRLQQKGYAVVYDPKVAINHFEFASSVVKEHAIALQRRNRQIFLERHRKALTGRQEPSPDHIVTARLASQPQRRILIIDDRVPHHGLGSGFPRAAEMIGKIHEFGYFITFYPLRFPQDNWRRVYATLPEEVEVIIDSGMEGLPGFIRSRAGYYTHLLVSRPHNMETISKLWAQDKSSFENCRIIYDAEAVFAIRERLQHQVLTSSPPREADTQAISQELGLAAIANRIITVSPAEAEHFRQHGYQEVQVVGHCLPTRPTPAPFAKRRGLLFVGAMHTNNAPNTDSMFWFVREVLPRLQKLLPEPVSLTIVGDCQATGVPLLAADQVHVLGRQEELTAYYNTARVFIAPTRFAAGIPMKAHEAAAVGLPLVATPLIAEQLGWQDEDELLTGGTAEEFAAQVARLYNDAKLWSRLRESALARVKRDCSEAAFTENLRRALS
ncbi:MAG: glycosyltransferase [Desulfobacteraceae bacterium]|nr:glycosyltransferase [Desulfobacteraceae bacterium]